VGDQVVDVDAVLHVPVDHGGHVGKAAGTTEGGTAPAAPDYQLEGAGGNLLACAGHADDEGLTPAFMGAFQCLAHHLDVADALEAVVEASGHLDDVCNHVLDVFRIDEVG